MQSITNLWNMVGQNKTAEKALDKLTNDQLIQFSDYIRDVFRNSDFLDPPTLCVVGSQSSGKSITLNGLTGIDILPNGKSIVTRTPIHLRLMHVKDSKNVLVEFFDRDDSQKVISSFNIDNQNASISDQTNQMNNIRDEIIRLTDMYAGKSKNVVDIPINIRIKSPDVPNLSVVDLPGLTNIALTDQGQPDNIKDMIESMLIKYIQNPRTIIISIVPSTIDVESDMGLGLIKRFDPDFRRTIGVLTKVDMLRDSNVEHYLSNKISRNLQLGYGYYAVRNRSTDEIKVASVKDGYVIENKFFTETEPYKSSDQKDRMGIINLGKRLSDVLLEHLRNCLPTVMEEIKNADKKIEMELNELGRDYPSNDSSKRTLINILLSDFQREYSGSIKDRGAVHNTGARMADSFNKFKQNMEKLDPFNPSIFNDNIITSMIRDYNGIHMPDVTISTGVIEKCFQGIDVYVDSKNADNSSGRIINKLEPLKVMREPYTQCIREIQNIQYELVTTILQRDKFARFPKFCSKIREIVVGQIIPFRFETANEKVDEFFAEETECIWTNDDKFRTEILPNMFSRPNSNNNSMIDPKIIRLVLSGYFNVIRSHAIHTIHKKIYTFFVNRVIDDINAKLIDTILFKADLNQLLEEHKEKALKREKLVKMKEKIDLAKNMFSNLH